jgi:predicted deacylase
MRLLSALLLVLSSPLVAATERTSDVVDGTPVIDRLDTRDLAAGQIHRFWFRVGDTSIGQGWYVPVIVVKGARDGPRLLLTAGIHGDEMNGISVIHRLAASVDPATLAGTLVMIPGLNTPGLLHHTREFTPDSGTADNLNRLMPGNVESTKNGERYAGRLWSRLLRPNADTAIDLHTQSRGTAYPMYAFAETKRAHELAMLVAPDILKLDPGEKGTVENELNHVGVPSITLELGRPEVFDATMIGRAVEGVGRVMADLKMVGDAPAATVTPFVANEIKPVRTTRGGYATMGVTLGQDVAKDQVIATVADPFGRVVETIRAPVAGKINTIATDPTREPGDMVVRIVWWSKDPKCKDGC